MTMQGTGKRGRKSDVYSFEKAHRGFHRKRIETSFGRIQLGMKKDLEELIQ